MEIANGESQLVRNTGWRDAGLRPAQSGTTIRKHKHRGIQGVCVFGSSCHLTAQSAVPPAL